ncbi:hypothetical protein HanRHA438_Chr12g0534301 [Helianthus annuus]|nr:hypothetical protein HanIR_Chr12g0563151 [Helianthus annuus]KAJ0864851.1 hypothetical protein HanRHA438_Chr12g0534301 [Helianthus annuus]
MCYQSSCYSSVENLMKTRRYILQPPRTTVAEDARETQETMKRCLCSPTNHPGSFRCRIHHKEYVWGGRATRVTM